MIASRGCTLTVAQAQSRCSNLCSSPPLWARPAGDGVPVVRPHKRLAIQALRAIPDYVELPELAGRHLADIETVLASAVVTFGGSEAGLARQAGPQAVEGGGVGAAGAGEGWLAGSCRKDVAGLGNCSAKWREVTAAANTADASQQ
jgi:hypothetical protein